MFILSTLLLSLVAAFFYLSKNEESSTQKKSNQCMTLSSRGFTSGVLMSKESPVHCHYSQVYFDPEW